MASRIVAIVVVLSACGSSGDDLDLFIGTWQYETGRVTVTCNGTTDEGPTPTGTITLAHGVDTPITWLDSDGCSVPLDLAETRAYTSRPQQCALATGTRSISTMSLQWRVDETLFEVASGSDETQTGDCRVSKTGTLVRVAF